MGYRMAKFQSLVPHGFTAPRRLANTDMDTSFVKRSERNRIFQTRYRCVAKNEGLLYILDAFLSPEIGVE